MKHLLAILALLLVPFLAHAQSTSLSNAQLATTCTAVKANSTANAARLAGDVTGLLNWLNGTASPASLAWNAATTPQTSDEAATYTTYDSLTQGKRDSWAILLLRNRDFGKNKVRNWVTDIWGSATASSVAESILQAATYNASNVQVANGGSLKTTGTVTATQFNVNAPAQQGDANWIVQPTNCN